MNHRTHSKTLVIFADTEGTGESREMERDAVSVAVT
jgi:hypothetical protein